MTKVVSVSPERLAGWLQRFAERHGPLVWDGVTATAPDGSVACLELPFGPQVGPVVEHALAERRVGVLLVRLGGHAVGIFEGPRLVVSKCGTRQVHGRSAAGGTSQLRFARRREGQVRVSLAAAADVAARVLASAAASLDAVVLGGDRSAVTAVMQDVRLRPLVPLVQDRVIDVPEPRLKVLEASPDLWRAVRITVTDTLDL